MLRYHRSIEKRDNEQNKNKEIEKRGEKDEGENVEKKKKKTGKNISVIIGENLFPAI